MKVAMMLAWAFLLGALPSLSAGSPLRPNTTGNPAFVGEPVFRYREGEPEFGGNIAWRNRVFPETPGNHLIGYTSYPEVFPSEEVRKKQLATLARNQAAFRRRIDQAHRNGQLFFTFNYDFTLWQPFGGYEDKEALLAAHPTARPHGGWRANWCPSDPFTFDFAVSRYRELFEAFPDIDGVILSYDSRGFIDCDCEKCAHYPWVRRMVDYLTKLNDALQKINPNVVIVVRTWNLPLDAAELARRVRDNICFMTKWCVPPANDFAWLSPVSTNIGRVPRLFTENHYCETGSGISHMFYAGRRMKEHYTRFARAGVIGVEAREERNAGIVREVMTLGRSQAAWNPFTFDPSAVLRDWAKRKFGEAGDEVFRALIDTDTITDALILDKTKTGSFQMYHFNPNQQSGYCTPLVQPAQIAHATEADYPRLAPRFEIRKAIRAAAESVKHLENAQQLRPTDKDIATLLRAAKATQALAAFFQDYHLALLNYRVYHNGGAASYLARSTDLAQSAVADAKTYRDLILSFETHTQDYLNMIPQEANAAYHVAIMRSAELTCKKRLWRVGSFDITTDTAAQSAQAVQDPFKPDCMAVTAEKRLLSDELGKAYTAAWEGRRGEVSFDAGAGRSSQFPPSISKDGITRVRIAFSGDLSRGGLFRVSFVPGNGRVEARDPTFGWSWGTVRCRVNLDGQEIGVIDDVSSRRCIATNKDYLRCFRIAPSDVKQHELTLELLEGSAVFDALDVLVPD